MTENLGTLTPTMLIRRAKKGDKTAFSLLYEQYFAPLYRYLYFRLGSKEEAEDLVQTVFVKAYKSLPRYREQGREPIAYFYTIARNALIDYRRKKREVLGDEPESIELIAADQHTVRDLFEHKRMYKALEEISDDQREIIILKFIADLTNEEIAQLLGKTEVAIRQLQSRGLRALKGIMNTTLT